MLTKYIGGFSAKGSSRTPERGQVVNPAPRVNQRVRECERVPSAVREEPSGYLPEPRLLRSKQREVSGAAGSRQTVATAAINAQRQECQLSAWCVNQWVAGFRGRTGELPV